jgi:cytochrome c55X
MPMLRPDLTMLALAATLAAIPALAGEGSSLERMVIQDCGSCHGLTMKGGLGRPLTPHALQHFDEAAIANIILDGIPGTAMPKWRPLLNEDQAMWMAHYLKSRTP